jgi:TIR domain
MNDRPFAFINYRRDDSREWANQIADAIQRHYGRSSVFIDTDGIRVGSDWSRKIEEALDRSTVILSVIGPQWLFLQNPNDGRRRLDIENDWVRREIEHALEKKKN